MKPLVFALPGNDHLANRIGAFLSLDVATVDVHRFPDGEARVQLRRSVAGKAVILTAGLDHADEKILPLLFTAATARDLGATSVGLVAPYLAYMRQDREFSRGEGVSARHFAHLLSNAFDWLLTVDPHLHRTGKLEDLYAIPVRAVVAARLLGDWIATHVQRPVIIGPDSESAQWVQGVAAHIGAPYVVLSKRRAGDESVAIKLPELSACVGHAPVLVDDIIASGATMIQATSLLRAAGWRAPVCVGVHAVFAGDSYASLQRAGAARIVTCNTITHPSNAIEISGVITAELTQFLEEVGAAAPGMEVAR